MSDRLGTVGLKVRGLLALVLEIPLDEVLGLGDDTPLFGKGLSLDSLTGLELLTGVEAEFGVDIASEDLNLDSLETIGTLTVYLSAGHRD
ncbi:MAG: acyl carrier protein [Chloroflexia bacterium]